MYNSLYSVATALVIVLPIAALAVGAALGFLLHVLLQKKKFGDAQQSANKITEEAYAEAKSVRAQAKNAQKEAILEAKEEIQKLRTEFDQELRERRNEVQRSEQRISQREDSIAKKEEALDRKNEAVEKIKASLAEKESKLDVKKAEIETAHERMLSEIEKVSQLTREEAKNLLLQEIEEDAKRDAAKMVR